MGSTKRVSFQGRPPPSPDSDDDGDLDGFVGVGDGSRRRRRTGAGPPPRLHDDDDDEDDLGGDSDSDQEIDRRARAKKRSQFERGVGNDVVEGEQIDTPAPDGFEPFHMKEERAQGWFDSAGNFNVEAEDIREAWLRDYDDRQADLQDSFIPDQPVDLARKGVKRYRPERGSATTNDEYEDIVDQARERRVLLQYLNTGETVLDALRRLGKSGDDDDKTAFTALTESADRLLQSGHYDVYQDTIGTVQSALNPSSSAAVSSSSGSSNQWEMRWSSTTDADSSEPIHGPYTSQQMDEWQSQGYFAIADRRCYVRVRGAPDPDWTDVRDIPSFANY